MPFRHVTSWLRPWGPRPAAETSRLIIGSTGSGKSEGELRDLVRLAAQGDCAVVLLDGHGPLAFRAAGHWAARGHEARLVYEPLHATDRVLCWPMLPKSSAPAPSQRLLEDAETRDEVAQCFLSQRDLLTFVDRPWTREWTEAAIALCLAQPQAEPLTSLLDAFRVGSAAYERLLTRCERPEVARKFLDAERLRRKSEVQYELQTGAARRLLEVVCASEVVRLRARPGPFDWLEAIRSRALVAFDGGGLRSRELKRALFLLVSMRVIHAVRLHFAETQQPLPVVLVLEEAGALGLVTPFVVLAMQELRKAGLAVHLITQSCLDFGERSAFEALLAHTPWQAWYQVLSPADQEIGAKALANATFDPLAVHYTRTRVLPDGAERVETGSRGGSFDPHTHKAVRLDHRTGTSFRTRYREEDEAHYKTPQLHEQQFRTRLATLRVGERLVRDRGGVRPERLRVLRPPRVRGGFEAFTRAGIERVRQRPLYQTVPPPPSPPPAAAPLDAAARLRGMADPGVARATKPTAAGE